MTTEEKAKAYDKALERARKCWGEYNEIVGAYENKGVCEEIFPELAESEDEKIRKELIQCFSDLEDQENEWYGSLTPKKIVAWLEKQGKHECGGDVNDEALQTQLQIWFDKGKCSGIDEVLNNPEKYGLQGEQKPVTPKFRVGDTIRNIKYPTQVYNISKIDRWCYISGETDETSIRISILDQDKWELVEQKPEWSEEDERIIEALIAASNDNMLYGYVDKKKLINWFKFLKERYCSQKQWKPTEEQITWLYRAVDMSDKDSRMKQVLNELLEQLKAL